MITSATGLSTQVQSITYLLKQGRVQRRALLTHGTPLFRSFIPCHSIGFDPKWQFSNIYDALLRHPHPQDNTSIQLPVVIVGIGGNVIPFAEQL